MNTKLVNSAAELIRRSMENGKQTPAGWAMDLESAQLLMSPGLAAELEQARLRVDEVERKYTFDTAELKRQLESARVDGRRLIRAEQRSAELEAVLGTHRDDDRAEIERLRARVAELDAKVLLLNTLRGDVALLVERERGFGEECVDIDDVEAALALGPDEVVEADGITRRIAPTQALREETTEEQPLTVYRAGFEGHDIPLDFYDNPVAAREHCEAFMRRESPDASFDWIEDEEDGVAELVATVDGLKDATGYIVTALTVASEFDEEADE